MWRLMSSCREFNYDHQSTWNGRDTFLMTLRCKAVTMLSWDCYHSKTQKSRTCQILQKQQSPPAWTQEAYRLWCIKYYWGGVPPPIVVPPQPGPVRGYPRWGTPPSGTPLARSDRRYSRWGTPMGYPLARSDRGYPRWGNPIGYPSQVWGVPKVGYPPLGYPQPGLRGYPRWGTPHWGTPSQVWQGSTRAGVPPCQVPPQPGLMGGTRGRVPPTRSNRGYQRWGTPHRDTSWQGYPLTGPGWGTPPAWTWLGYPPPPGVDRQMDRHESKHSLPVVLRTRSVIKQLFRRRK